MKTTHLLFIAAVVVPPFAAFAFGCDDAKPTEKPASTVGPVPTTTATATGSTPVTDGGFPVDPDSGKPLDCFPDPKTNEEILNRCSPLSERVSKTPVLPLKYADGGVPVVP